MSDEFSNAIKELKVKADIANLPEDVMDHFEEEGKVIDAELSADGKLGVTAQKIGLTGASMEQFMNTFLEQVSTEAWDPRNARQFDMGIQTILTTVGLSCESVGFEASFESQGVALTKEEQKDTAEKSGDGVLKKIWGWLVAAIKKIVAATGNFFTTLDRMAGSIEKVGSNLSTLVKGRTFKTGELKGAWTRYLKAGDKTMGASEALSKASQLMTSITDAWSHDTASSLQTVKTGGAAKTAQIAALHWPIQWPGGTTMKLEGDDLAEAKFSSAKGEGGGADAHALTRVEADAVIKQISGAATSVRSLKGKLKTQVEQYEAMANQLAKAENFKRGSGDMASGRRAAALTSKSDQVNKACATAIFDVVKCAVQHVKASMGGNAA